VELWVARGFSGSGSLQFEKAGDTPVYGSVSILSTGGWQTWVKDAHLNDLSTDPIEFGIIAQVVVGILFGFVSPEPNHGICK
jgi:hypothetical protein